MSEDLRYVNIHLEEIKAELKRIADVLEWIAEYRYDYNIKKVDK